ncbi:MAG: hypothetical protein K6T26_08165 [Alicyclobacillus sp.]|nr:hypothetical protein [Alicyclobacillus sp.]
MTQNEWMLACAVGIPVAFALGRLSARIPWLQVKDEKKYSLPEFVRGRS